MPNPILHLINIRQRTVPVLCLLFAIAAANSYAADAQTPGAPRLNSRQLTIQSGDLLTLNVFDEPQFGRDVRVDPEGAIDVPYAGRVHVAGETPSEAATAVEQAYREHKILLQPQVSLLVAEYAGGSVSVLGEVKTPGVYKMMGNHTLLDALSLAGGLMPTANSTITIKRRGGEQDVVTVHLRTENARISIDDDVPIYPNDLIVVPKSGIVYVLGDVVKPGGFTIPSDGNFTVLDAVSEAQGTAKTASIKKVKLLRKDEDGDVSTIDIPFKKIQTGAEKDIALRPNDVIYIPNSALRSSAVTLAGLGGAVATAAIYSTH